MDINDVEFDCPFQVHLDGTVTDVAGVYAPDLFDGELSDSNWEMLNGYSGQHGYSGPIMHSSEYLGGQMEKDVLATPGIYVLVAAYWTEDEGADEGADEDDVIEGWALCKLRQE